MAFLYSNKFSGIDFSIAEIFDISQTISRDFQVVSAKSADLPKLMGGLSQAELLTISLTISREFAPSLHSQITGLETPAVLAPTEIRTIAANIAASYAPQVHADHDNLVLLPLDAENIYAYWQLADHGSTRPNHLEQPLVLKITTPDPLTSFEIAVSDSQGQQKIALPPSCAPACYMASLGQYTSASQFSPIINSNLLTRAASLPLPAQSQPEGLALSDTSATVQPLLTPIMSGNSINKTASGQNHLLRQ